MTNKSVIDIGIENNAPQVPFSKTKYFKLYFVGMVFLLVKNSQLYRLKDCYRWNNWQELGHSMLFAIGRLFRLLAFLLIMIYKAVCKAVCLSVVILPVFLTGEEFT